VKFGEVSIGRIPMKIRSAIIASTGIALASASPQALVAQPRVAVPGTPRSAAERTYSVLQFRFATGDDDLRGDTRLFATITLPDKSTQNCELHGGMATGGEANITWDNRSTHNSAPCRLDHPMRLGELKRLKIDLSVDQGGQFAYGLSNDNWNINSLTVQAYNSGEADRINLFCFQGEPMLVRMTGDMGTVTITDLPTRC
jgi:hypothetical protein